MRKEKSDREKLMSSIAENRQYENKMQYFDVQIYSDIEKFIEDSRILGKAESTYPKNVCEDIYVFNEYRRLFSHPYGLNLLCNIIKSKLLDMGKKANVKMHTQHKKDIKDYETGVIDVGGGYQREYRGRPIYEDKLYVKISILFDEKFIENIVPTLYLMKTECPKLSNQLSENELAEIFFKEFIKNELPSDMIFMITTIDDPIVMKISSITLFYPILNEKVLEELKEIVLKYCLQEYKKYSKEEINLKLIKKDTHLEIILSENITREQQHAKYSAMFSS